MALVRGFRAQFKREVDLEKWWALQSIFAVPCPTRNSPLVMTPGFDVQYLQGPKYSDLPPRLYDGYVDFRWLSQDGLIPVADNVLFAGVLRSSRNKGGARAVLPSIRRRMIESV